jgi:hypothetical protein
LPEIIHRFSDVPLTSVAIEEIGLEHVYLEIMHQEARPAVDDPEENQN